VREEQGEVILKTNQPRGQSGLPLAAEMILRAIAEQVETLAESQTNQQGQGLVMRSPHSDELNDLFSEFLGKLHSYVVKVQDSSELNLSVESLSRQITKGIRDLIQAQRSFHTKLEVTSGLLSSQMKSHITINETVAQCTRSAEIIVNELRNSMGKHDETEANITRVSELGLQLSHRFESLNSEYSEMAAEVSRLRAREQNTNALWTTLSEIPNKKMDSLKNLIEVNDLLKSTVQHLQLLAVNTGIEAAKSDVQESGLGFIAADLKVVAEQFASSQREFSQQLLALRDSTEEAISMGELLTQKMNQSTTKPKADLRLEAQQQSHIYDIETIRNRFRDELSKLKNSANNQQVSLPTAEREGLSLIKSLQESHRLIFKEAQALKQVLTGLSGLPQDEAIYEGALASLRHDHDSLRTLRSSLSEKLDELKFGAEMLKNECESIASGVESGLAAPPLIGTGEVQLSEINEQLKQCAQEIFSLVDTPDRSQRAAS